MNRTQGDRGVEWWNPESPQIPIDVVHEDPMFRSEEAEAEVLTRTPSLARPFAVFGAAAGLFAILALGSFRPPAREVSPLTPAIVTAIIGAIAGVVLQRWRRLHQPMLTREAQVVSVGMVTSLAGAASGGAVGIVTWGADGFLRFAFGGAIVGLLFLPSGLVVFDAARRAGRGRHGSLVAATDRRTVFSTVLGGVAFAAATQVPAILNAEVSNELEPIVQALLSIVLSLGAVVAIAALQRRDRQANASLESFKRDAAWLDRVSSNEEAAADANSKAVDLGIGAEQWSRTTDQSYRVTGRPDVLVKGSIEEAAKAFDECVQRRHRSLMVAVASLTAVTVSFLLRLGVYL